MALSSALLELAADLREALCVVLLGGAALNTLLSWRQADWNNTFYRNGGPVTRYSCPCDEEFEAYEWMPRTRGYLERHARACPDCDARLEPHRRRVRHRLWLAVLAGLALAVAAAAAGLAWLP